MTGLLRQIRLASTHFLEIMRGTNTNCCVRIQYQDPCNGRAGPKTWLEREKKAEADEPKLSYAKNP